jgi:Zn-dependent peptidase ImmA (M78 family)
MDNTTHNTHEGPSVLTSLRSLIPPRRLEFTEALQIAELQAHRLLELSSVSDWPVPSEIVTELPRIQVTYRDLPTSGLSYWDGTVWVVCLNHGEPPGRQRFTLLHEFKHIVDHGRTAGLYAGSSRHSPEQQAEQAADYFAGCALMSKQLLKRAWGEGLQRPEALAHRFAVSPRAIEVRLMQLGLTDPYNRCAPPSMLHVRQQDQRAYYRQRSPRQPLFVATQGLHS